MSKTYYELLFSSEDSESVLVEMTVEEALIVKRVLEEADKGLESKYCGRVKLLDKPIVMN